MLFCLLYNRWSTYMLETVGSLLTYSTGLGSSVEPKTISGEVPCRDKYGLSWWMGMIEPHSPISTFFSDKERSVLTCQQSGLWKFSVWDLSSTRQREQSGVLSSIQALLSSSHQQPECGYVTPRKQNLGFEWEILAGSQVFWIEYTYFLVRIMPLSETCLSGAAGAIASNEYIQMFYVNQAGY